jgi:hypothetical protein
MKMESRNWQINEKGKDGAEAIRAGRSEFIKFPYKRYETAQLLSQLHCLKCGLERLGLKVDLPEHWLPPLEQ